MRNCYKNYIHEVLPIYHLRLFITSMQVIGFDDQKVMEEYNRYDSSITGVSKNGIGFFCNLAFVNLISQVEIFISNMICEVLIRYPKKIGGVISFDLVDILEKDRDELILEAVEKHLNSIMYKKPSEYLSALASLLSFDSKTLENEWKKYVELKIRRDIGVHNNWKINSTYLRKAKEAGIDVVGKNIGDLITIDEDYLDGALKDCNEMVKKINNHCMETFKNI